MKKILILISILIFSGIIYFYKLNKIPSGVYVDEATVAYNAYSIFQTGLDEYGYKMPIYFRLMGSYTPSLFIYLSSFLMKFSNYSIVLFRSISAISAIISVVFLYLLSNKLNLYKSKVTYFLITFLYSISPWIVFNARLGYETTLGFLVFNIGVYFLFIAIEKPKYIPWGVFLLSISTYVSHNQRFLAPLFILFYLIIFRKNLFKNKDILIKSFILGLVTQIPNILMLTTPAFWIKNGQFDLKYVWNFLNYLSPKTLFFLNPDIDLQHTLPKISVMYDWMTIPYLIGIYLLIKRVKETNVKFLVVYSLITLIPAVFSGYFLSTQRSFVFVIPLMLIIGLGIDEIINFLNKKIALLIFAILTIYSLITLYSSYFVLFPKERAVAWNYGYDEVVQYILYNPKEIFLLDDSRNPRAYSLLLYYFKYSPQAYRKELGTFYKDNYYSASEPAPVYKFANVEIRPLDWEKDPKQNLIIIGDNLSVSESQMKEHKLTKIKEIKDPMQNVIFVFYKTDKLTQ